MSTKDKIQDERLYNMVMGIKPQDLVGFEFDFYGAHSNCFKIDSFILECIEDPIDGYRSAMECLRFNSLGAVGGFFAKPLCRVKVEEDIEDFLFRLVDTQTGHTWLEFGTGDPSGYYPYFVFTYYASNGQPPKS